MEDEVSRKPNKFIVGLFWTMIGSSATTSNAKEEPATPGG